MVGYNKRGEEEKNTIKMSQQSPIVFVHNYRVENSSDFNFHSSDSDKKCICRACQIQNPLLPKLSTLFFIGFIFPFIYIYIWSCRIYAILCYRQELKEPNKEFELMSASSSEQGTPTNSPDPSLSNSAKNDFKFDNKERETDLNPFSDSYAINEEVSATNCVKNYDFEAHCYTNLMFRTWCYRSLIAFTCQLCLIIVIVCAVVLTKKSAHSSTDYAALGIPAPNDPLNPSDVSGVF